MDIQGGDTTRTAKLYVPDGTPQGAMVVVMTVPEGQETLSFLKDSGWMDKADAEGICLFVLEPAEGTSWGSLEDEMAYITAGVNAEKAGKWLQPGPSLYLVGYGDIGSDLQKYAMENPLNIAGAVFLDASNIDADYIKTNGDVSFNTDTKTYDVTRKEFPVPVKIVGSAADTKAVLDYWKAAAADENALSRFAPEGQAILDAAVQTEEKTYDYTASSTTDMIYDFLGQFYRYGGGVLSNSISWKVDYEEMGVEVKSFTDSQGIDRQYLVYIPEAYRTSSEKLPVVIAYHGASTSMRNFFENTLWYNIADEEGIILVFPESTLVPVPSTLGGGEANPTAYRALWQVEDPALRYTDVVYANELLDQLEAEYPQIDTGRIYCTGHSMGCMMTHYLGSTSVADRFAAMGATSGPLMAKETEDTVSQIVPMFMTMAQYDMWSGDLQKDGTMVTNAVDMWLINNGLATEDNVAEVRKTGASETYVDGRFENTLWKNEDGVTLFRYALVSGKDHVNMPSENQLLWNEWFSQITLNTETGVRTFNGQEIK
jgi:poly(3-hydroxybutyrate) depolymerase